MNGVRGVIELVLPAVVERFEVSAETELIVEAAGLTVEISGPYVGVGPDGAFWEEMEPDELDAHLVGFAGFTLDAIETGQGWLHLEFSRGWVRVVASEWDSWVVGFEGGQWWGGEHPSPVPPGRITGRA